MAKEAEKEDRNRLRELEENVQELKEEIDRLAIEGMLLSDRLYAAKSGLRAIHAMTKAVPFHADPSFFVSALGAVEDFSSVAIDSIWDAEDDSDD